jgi:hypothetical protein
MSEAKTRLEAIRARWAKATPGPYRRLTWTFESMDQQTAEWSQALRNRPDGLTSHVVWVVDTDLFVASTGNGPTSEVNAEAIAAAPEDVAYMLRVAEAARAVISHLDSLPNDWRADEFVTYGPEEANALALMRRLAAALEDR